MVAIPDVSGVFWLLLLFMFLYPQYAYWSLNKTRRRLMRQVAAKRHSQLITLIHRQERLALLGIPIFKFIDMDDSEEILRVIRSTPQDKPIDLIIHSAGGMVLAAAQIARALRSHKGPTRVIVPHYAMSGGTLIALAADEIIMGPQAVLGPVDPQILTVRGSLPAQTVMEVAKIKGKAASDDTLILAKVGERAIRQIRDLVFELLKGRMLTPKIKKVSDFLTSGKLTHDYPITMKEAAAIGLNVSDKMPEDVYLLMETYETPSDGGVNYSTPSR